MSKTKITLSVCRSCIRDNPQSEAAFCSEQIFRETWSKRLKKGFFGKIAELKVLDCLTNCHNSNSVRIERIDGEILFGRINSEAWVNAVITLAQKLQNPNEPLTPSEVLQEKLIEIRPKAHWG